MNRLGSHMVLVIVLLGIASFVDCRQIQQTSGLLILTFVCVSFWLSVTCRFFMNVIINFKMKLIRGRVKM